jgi:hypothetical protein
MIFSLCKTIVEKMKNVLNISFLLSVFELLERGEVLEVPTDVPLTEEQAWKYFRDVVMGIEYRKFVSHNRTFGY